MVNLIHQAAFPMHITLLEKSSALAKGIAYGTADPCHLLNVRANRMGAFAENPEHFYQWLTEKALSVDPESYLPRMLYGTYLEDLLQKSLTMASQKGIKASVLHAEAVRIEPKAAALSIALKGGSSLQADAAILALGVPQNKEFCTFAGHNPNYISSIWAVQPLQIRFSNETTVVMIGSGLTMVDAYASLLIRGFRGRVIAISRHGKLPAVHAQHPIPYSNFLDLRHPPATALQLLKVVRREVRLSSAKGIDWRGVVDELREIIGPLWEQFSWQEREKGIRHLLNMWNHFRHRMPQHYWAYIQKEQAEGRFNLVRGKVLSIIPPSVEYRPLGSSQSQIVKADYIINCSGPDMNIHNHKSDLMQNLIKDRLVFSDPLKSGILADSDGIVQGDGQGRLFAVGQLLFGERLESTAVPNLRIQCRNLAAYLLRKFAYHDSNA